MLQPHSWCDLLRGFKRSCSICINAVRPLTRPLPPGHTASDSGAVEATVQQFVPVLAQGPILPSTGSGMGGSSGFTNKPVAIPVVTDPSVLQSTGHSARVASASSAHLVATEQSALVLRTRLRRRNLRFQAQVWRPLFHHTYQGLCRRWFNNATTWFIKPLNEDTAEGADEDKRLVCRHAYGNDAVLRCSHVLQYLLESTPVCDCVITLAMAGASCQGNTHLPAIVWAQYDVADHPYLINWPATIMCTRGEVSD